MRCCFSDPNVAVSWLGLQQAELRVVGLGDGDFFLGLGFGGACAGRG